MPDYILTTDEIKFHISCRWFTTSIHRLHTEFSLKSLIMKYRPVLMISNLVTWMTLVSIPKSYQTASIIISTVYELNAETINVSGDGVTVNVDSTVTNKK